MITPSRVLRGCLLAAALLLACGCLGGRTLAQGAPPGFDAIPRPPGSIGPTQNLMPPGAGSGVLAPQAPANPLQLAPPAQPVALPPPASPPAVQAPPPAAAPTIPMVPPGQV